MEPSGVPPKSMQEAQVQLPGLNYLPGRISRSDAKLVALQFDNPLYEPVFEDLKVRLRK